ncbi:MAG: hypothetical protein BWY22_01892 [Bacteroidetes bacterium ADurb.Bin217]|nr:MAG: hypothetical protein BWY22_01892 [Bacteroidetes bacterium ADurb.Bin217]
MKITWTREAQEQYGKILEYLELHWSIKEIESFIFKTESVLQAIQNNPYLYVKSTKQKNICKALITKHNSMFYLVNLKEKEIILLSFWDNRQDPEKCPY